MHPFSDFQHYLSHPAFPASAFVSSISISSVTIQVRYWHFLHHHSHPAHVFVFASRAKVFSQSQLVPTFVISLILFRSGITDIPKQGQCYISFISMHNFSCNCILVGLHESYNVYNFRYTIHPESFQSASLFRYFGMLPQGEKQNTKAPLTSFNFFVTLRPTQQNQKTHLFIQSLLTSMCFQLPFMKSFQHFHAVACTCVILPSGLES